MKRFLLTVSVAVTVVLALVSCDKNPADVINPQISDTTLIRMTVLNKTSASTMTFQWDSESLNAVSVVIGIFTNKIQSQGKKILNVNDCVAIWNNDMTGTMGSVGWSYFKAITNGVVLDSAPAISFGTTCYYALWAFDSSMEITHSSQKDQFFPMP